MSDLHPEKRARIEQEAEGEKILLNNYRGNCEIRFRHDLGSRETCLFELTPALEKSLQQGERLRIKGSSSDAVLVTDSATFSIKRVETSNDIFYIEPSRSNVFEISFKCKDFFELSLTKGRVDKLIHYLKDTKYIGAGHEGKLDKSKLVTRSQLDSLVLASDKEIASSLAELNIVEMGGYMRLLDEAALAEAIEILIQTIVEHNLRLEQISEDQVIDLIPETESVFIRQALAKLGNSTGTTAGTWALDWESVCRRTARFQLAKLASNENKLINMEEFMTLWFSNSPGTEQPPARLLEGLAIVEEISPSIRGAAPVMGLRFLPVDTLPIDAKGRFERLFQVRTRYTLEELRPYSVGLVGGVGQPKTLPELLVQCTKCIDNYYYNK